MPAALVYRSYAKLNLYLDVLARRPDGYHDIETLFQTVSLCDEMQFSERRARVSVACSVPELNVAEANLAYRAAMLLRERTGCRHGARIVLEKQIPIAAGLGGGSGNAAATLSALNQLWNLSLPDDDLHALAAELGSDVPFCLKGGTAAAWGRGEVLAPVAPLRATWFILIHPAMPVSTSRVYNDPRLTFSGETPVNGRTPRFEKAIDALARGDLREALFNRMEQVVFADHPQLADTKQRLLDAGCVAAAMSGSGPTLFGACGSKQQAVKIGESFSDCKTSVVCTAPAGLERQ